MKRGRAKRCDGCQLRWLPACALLLVLLSPQRAAAQVDVTSFVVTKTADTNDGTCDADCSLREAITAANNDAGAETITFNIPNTDAGCTGSVCTINLTGVLPDLSSMTIQGPGANLLTVRRDTGGDYRIFRILSGQAVTISGLTISNGRVLGTVFPDDGGAGIFNRGSLTLAGVAVSGNTAQLYGGGITSAESVLNVSGSAISGNQTLDSNAAGGGIYIFNSTATLTNTTISGNTSAFGGGMIVYNPNPNVGASTITNCTISNNTATQSGGGIHANSGTTNFGNTIVAHNTAATGSDIYRTVTSQGYNLIDDTSGATITGDTSTNITGRDPRLGPLSNNGGPTQTHFLFANSPAIDNGSSALTTDQRGQPRPIDNQNMQPTRPTPATLAPTRRPNPPMHRTSTRPAIPARAAQTTSRATTRRASPLPASMPARRRS